MPNPAAVCAVASHRLPLKIGAIEPLCYPLQIRTTNKGDSIVPNFLKVSFQKMCCYRNRCVFQTLREHQILRRVCFNKRCYRTAVVSSANTDNKQGHCDSINFSEGCRFNWALSNRCVFRNVISERRFDSTTFRIGYI